MNLDIVTLRGIVGEYDYGLCTKRENAVAEKAIEKAKIYVQSFYNASTKTYDETDELISNIIMTRAAYEIYVKGKMFKFSEQKRIEAQTMLIMQLGEVANINKSDEMKAPVRKTEIVVKRGASSIVNWNAYDN